MKWFFTRGYKAVSGIVVVSLLAVSIGMTPLNYKAEQQAAHAQLFGAGAVTVIGGNGTIQESLSAAANTATAALQNAFYIKEFTLDGIFHGLAKMVLKSMTQSLLNWINSGFQGSPAFVTDLKQFILDRLDVVVGDFIYNDPALNFLCSPFQLDVKIALATTYQEQAHEGFGSEAQCTLSEVTDNIEGFLNGDSFDPASWFEVTQNPINTPTGAYLEAKTEMYARIIDEEGNTIKELDWGDGFLSFKVCSGSDAASGAQTDCDITTPGRVIADQINHALGAPQDALIAADEIDEIIGALFAQLANMAIRGLTQLASGGFTTADGREFDSYLDALEEENPVQNLSNPIEDAVKREEEHIELQNTVIDEVNNIEAYLLASEETYASSSCFNLTMSQELVGERNKAITAVINSEATLPVLMQLRDSFASSTNPEEQLQIITVYNEMESSNLLVDISANNLLQVYIDFELSEMIRTFKEEIDQEKDACEDDN